MNEDTLPEIPDCAARRAYGYTDTDAVARAAPGKQRKTGVWGYRLARMLCTPQGNALGRDAAELEALISQGPHDRGAWFEIDTDVECAWGGEKRKGSKWEGATSLALSPWARREMGVGMDEEVPGPDLPEPNQVVQEKKKEDEYNDQHDQHENMEGW